MNSDMHEHQCKQNGAIDKETVAICIQASVTCYLHVLHRYTRMVYKIVPYVYGTYHTRMVCTICVWYKICVWYRTSLKYRSIKPKN